MNKDQREEHGRAICGKVTAQVARISPPGLGRWEPTWKLVEGPSDRFLDALDRWVEADTPERRAAVQVAADQLLLAWTEAAGRFRLANGRSSLEGNHATV